MQITLKQINGEAGFYKLDSAELLNKYYVLSSAGSSRLMASPEIVGYDSYLASVPSTERGLNLLMKMEGKPLGPVNILTILRGGLNYPLEESCHRCGIPVSAISFLSCERIIKDDVIIGLDVRYEKLHVEPDCTLAIGDIIASGETLRLCLSHVVERFRESGQRIRRIIFFTVGGTKAIRLMEEFTADVRRFWPDFEGFDCFFYEGVFTVYGDNGVTGVNVPDIDFGWKGGYISPEFRKYVLCYKYAPAMLEKCIIYDGGARRYEIGLHKEEVTDYWERLLKAAPASDFKAFLDEKRGSSAETYEEWLEANHYSGETDLHALFDLEQEYVAELLKCPLDRICRDRLSQIEKDFKHY